MDGISRYKDSFKCLNKIALVFSIFLFSRVLGFLPFQLPSVIEYGGVVIMAIFCISKAQRLEIIYVVLLLYLLLNVFMSNINPIFKPWERLAYFTLLIFSSSAIFQSDYLRKMRSDMLVIVLSIGTVFSILSFFCWFLGINFMVRIYMDINTPGGFGGLFKHSMTMGPIAGMSMMYMIYKYLKEENKIYLIFATFCLGAMIFSACRTAIVCTLFGMSVMLYKINVERNKKLILVGLSAIVLSVSFPIWSSYTEMLMRKQINNMENGSVFFSRDIKWSARLDEFNSNPISGIGFSSIDPIRDKVLEGGTIEPGSSWLAILSMTGIIGFVLIICLFLNGYKSIKNSADDNSLLLGLFVFFMLFMITDGCIFAAGFFLCFVLWLVIGVCYDNKYLICQEDE